MKYKPFDWDEAKRRNEQTARWLKTIHDKPLTEAEYVDQWLALPHHSLRSSRTQPAKQYRYLKRVFGFFGGTEQ